jgi:L,D-transpeptidase YbiS
LHQLLIDVHQQRLIHEFNDQIIKEYPISTAANGVGEIKGSEKTPRGWHIIRAKIGHGMPLGTVFISRRPTGEICTLELQQRYPDRDWILTRILWLSGLEIGKNRLGNFDTMQRYIYIHGCPEDRPMGVPASRGCIRMRNRDIIELFDAIPAGTKVYIDG